MVAARRSACGEQAESGFDRLHVGLHAEADVKLGRSLDREDAMASFEVEIGRFGQADLLKPLLS